ncbi:MAG: hypothetical protein P0120_15040 [Nitrospira sp.]|nr:hypothetical protein [Nitrospira sp.]
MRLDRVRAIVGDAMIGIVAGGLNLALLGTAGAAMLELLKTDVNLMSQDLERLMQEILVQGHGGG